MFRKYLMFHLTADGPKECRAHKRPCPLGGEHYETKSEAEQAYTQQFEVLVTHKRHKSSPDIAIRHTKVDINVATHLASKIVLSDVDGTLVRGSLANDHAVWMHNRGIVDLGDLPARWLADPKNEELITALAEANLKAIAGKSLKELRVSEFMDEMMQTDNKFYSSLAKLVQARREGNEVVLISGSPQYLINDFAKRFGFKGVGSTYHMDHARKFNGRITGMFGADSKRRYVKKLQIERFDLIDAYGDTASDKPLLEVATHSVLVDPTQETLLSYQKVDEILRY